MPHACSDPDSAIAGAAADDDVAAATAAAAAAGGDAAAAAAVSAAAGGDDCRPGPAACLAPSWPGSAVDTPSSDSRSPA